MEQSFLSISQCRHPKRKKHIFSKWDQAMANTSLQATNTKAFQNKSIQERQASKLKLSPDHSKNKKGAKTPYHSHKILGGKTHGQGRRQF